MKSILVVDNRENYDMISAILSGDFETKAALSDGGTACALCDFAAVLVNADIANLQENEFFGTIKDYSASNHIPMIYHTGENSGEVMQKCYLQGADDCIKRPFDEVVLKNRIANLIELYSLRYRFDEMLAKDKQSLDIQMLSTIITFANILDAGDKYTGGHSLRVAECSRDIAINLGWNKKDTQNLYYVALLHDIGIVAVPEVILNKPGRLTAEEYETVKKHSAIGSEILRDIKIIDYLCEGARFHHERWDGAGYPDGLAGENIPMYARIIAIADAYDAMHSDRIYRKHLSEEKIISEFERCKGTQFDPELTEVFIFMLRDGYEVNSSVAQSREVSKIVSRDGGLTESIVKRMNLQITTESEEDSLTGLFNRSFLNLQVSKRVLSEEPGALMLLDLDNFKEMNDRIGHDRGDIVLKMFADELRKQFRDKDVICKMDNDLFAVFISDCPDKSIIVKKAGIINDIACSGDIATASEGMTSVSIGVAFYPENGVTFEELYGAADKALYHVKKNGKNKYHFYGMEDGGLL